MSSREERLEAAKKDSFLVGLAVGARSPSQVPKAIESLRALGIEFTGEAEKIAKVVAQLKKSDQEKFKAIFGKMLERKESRVDKKEAINKEQALKKIRELITKSGLCYGDVEALLTRMDDEQIERAEKEDRELVKKAKKSLKILQNIVNSDSISKFIKETKKKIVVAEWNHGDQLIYIGYLDREGRREGRPAIFHCAYPCRYSKSLGRWLSDYEVETYREDKEITKKDLERFLEDCGFPERFSEWYRARIRALAGLTKKEIWKRTEKQI